MIGRFSGATPVEVASTSTSSTFTVRQRLHDVVDARRERGDVGGFDGREHADAQLVAAELAVAVGVDDAVGPQRGAHVVGVDARRRGRSCRPRAERLAGSATNGVAHSRRLGPAVQDRRPTSSQRLDAPVEPAVVEHPLELLVEQDERGQRRRVVVWSSGGCRARCRGRATPGIQRSPTRRCARCARPRRASRRRATARRRWRSTSAARSSRRRPRPGRPRAGRRRPTWRRRRRAHRVGAGRAAQLHRHAGRGLVVGERVRRRRRSSADGIGWSPGVAAMTTGSSRCGAAAQRVGELRRELAEHEVLAAPLDRARTWRRPRTRWCRRCRARSPSRRAARTARASPARTAPTRFLHRRLAVRACRAGCCSAGERQSTCSGRTFDGPQPNRPSAGSRSSGDVDRGRVVVTAQSRAPACAVNGCRRHVAAAELQLAASRLHRRAIVNRTSARLAAIAESATLAVDAKAKALQGAGRERHRLRRRRARLPDARRTSSRPRAAACRDPKNHKYTPAAGLPELREAIAAKTLRDSRLRVPGRPGARHQRRQARRVHRLRRAVRPGRRGDLPGAVLDDLPRGDHARRRRAGDRRDRRDDRLPGHRRPARGGAARRAPRCCCSSAPTTRRGAVYPPDEVEAIGRVGGRATASGWSPTRSTSTSSTATNEFVSRCRRVVPDLADQCVIVNGVAKTYAMTGWRVGWMIGPTDVIEGGDQLPERTPRRTSPTSPSVPRSPRSAATSSAVAMMRDAFDRRAVDDARDAQRHPRRHVHRAAGRVLLLPELHGLLGRPLGRTARSARPRSSSPTSSSSEAKVAFVPGEAFGTPGYARFSLRPRRRRHRRRHPPHRRPRRRLSVGVAPPTTRRQIGWVASGEAERRRARGTRRPARWRRARRR